jgi:hypothetical protein
MYFNLSVRKWHWYKCNQQANANFNHLKYFETEVT